MIRSKVVEMIEDNLFEKERVRFRRFVDAGGFKRAQGNALAGRAIKPCGRECREYGYKIVEMFDHKSLENFAILMDDAEFLLHCALISPNPQNCFNYFYHFVNENLKRNKTFRMEFLKAIYLNDNVYTLESINWFVDSFGFQKENEALRKNQEFKKRVQARLGEQFEFPEYHYNGQDKRKLTKYKMTRNDIKQLNENRLAGLNEILDSFEEEKKTCYDFRSGYSQ